MASPNVNPVRLQQLLDQASRLPPEQRAAHVRQSAAHDPALREAALAALALHVDGSRSASGFFSRRDESVDDRAGLPPELQGLQAGRRIGDFTLLRFLGKGGMGQVWEARQESLKRNVALKLMLPGRIDERTLELFVREAKAGGKCHHPHLVATLGRGEDEGIAWLAQELVAGAQTLEDALDHFRDLDRLPDDYYQQVAHLVEKLAMGLQAAHDAGVIHRDLKPQNVLIGADDEPRVADFGLARVVGDSVASQTGDFAGTYFYMSPEQVAAKRIGLDHRTDVWSLGVVLYELLTLQRPFVGDTGQQIAQQIAQWDPPRADLVRSQCPRDLGVIAEKAMQKVAVQRYPSMAALAADLRRHLEDRPILAKPTGRVERARKWVRRNPTVSATVAAVFVGGLVAGTLAWQNAELAAEKGALAEQKGRTVSNFNQLAAVVRLKDVLAKQDELWPAWPDKVEALKAWLEQDCAQLLAMKPGIEATIAELRSKAIPLTPEQVEADRRAAPEWPQFERQQQLVASLRRARAIRTGAETPELPELPAALRDADASALNSFAWPRVAPEKADGETQERMTFGEEAMALVAARAAASKAASQEGEFQFLDTLAWAALANGLDDEAKARTAEALAKAPSQAREEYVGYQRAIEAAIAEAQARLAAAESRLAQLDTAVSERRTWVFGEDAESESARFLHDALVGVRAGLESMAAKEKVDVEQRLIWAQQVRAASLSHPKAPVTWADAREAIAKADGVVASTLYAGRNIRLPDDAVTGLVPIGMNPVTKLWEFYDLRSAWDGKQSAKDIEIPRHKEDGSIEVKDATGIVFVLLPGGTVTLGSQNEDPKAPLYDPQRADLEILHEVTLSPFLIARHEMTQGQWLRLWTWDAELRETSYYKSGSRIGVQRITLSHPVEQVDWMMSDRLVTRHGMTLPTESQWEYGCRGGTATPWIVDRDELKAVANLADADARRAVPSWTCENWRDGHIVPAPVGSFGANAFGLFDVHGNVWEWCRDLWGPYGGERPGDGVRPNSVSSPSDRVLRGGSFSAPAANARSARRNGNAPSVRNGDLGLRPARLITE